MMKQVLICCLLAVAGRAAGQVSPLPVDSTTGKVTYQAVVAVPGVSQAELYRRARAWFATNFGSAKAVLEMDDREAAQLVGNANAPFAFAAPLSGTVEFLMWRQITVEAKEGRYRYTLTRFRVGSETQPASQATPVESWLDRKSRVLYDKEGKPKRIAASVLIGVSETAASEIKSLGAAMQTPAAGKSDW